MSDELTAADVSWRARSEGIIQDVLRGATVTDSAVNVYDDGSVGIEWIEARLKDGRVVDIRPPECDGGPVTINVYDDDVQREMTVRQDFTEHREGAPTGSILVLNRTGGLSAMPAPDFCPHKDGGCPGSDCCEEGDRCARAAARGRS